MKIYNVKEAVYSVVSSPQCQYVKFAVYVPAVCDGDVSTFVSVTTSNVSK